MIFGGTRVAAIAAEDARALRAELGWTQEQLADAARVSPLEVSAWEAGVVPVLSEQAQALAWAAWRERRVRAWAAAGARPCAWGAEIRARCDQAAHDEPGQLVRDLRKLQVHQKRCAACARAAQVERTLPREPPEIGPRTPLASLLRTLRTGHGLPAPLRLPQRVAMAVFGFAMVMIVVEGFHLVTDPSYRFDPPVRTLVLLLAAYTGWLLADEGWDEVYFARPHVGGFLKAATMAAPASVIAVSWFSAEVLVFALAAVLVIGLYLGGREADAQEDERKAALAGDPPAAPSALPGSRVEPDVEREVVRDVVDAPRHERRPL